MGWRLFSELKRHSTPISLLQGVRKLVVTIFHILIGDLKFAFELNLLVQRVLDAAAGWLARSGSRVALRVNSAQNQNGKERSGQKSKRMLEDLLSALGPCQKLSHDAPSG